MGQSPVRRPNEKGGVEMKFKFWKSRMHADSTPHANIYDSIENLPIWNWNKISETSDFTWLRINRINGQVTKKEFEVLKKTWEKIFAEYITRFHWGDNFLMIHNKEKEISFLQHQFIVSGDRFICTFVELARKELENMKKKDGNDFDFWDMKTQLEIICKMQIDPRKTSVVEFYSYLKNINSRKSA